MGNIWGGGGLAGRIDNAAQYRTPALGGFNASLTHSPEEGDNDTAITVAKLDYAKHDFKIGAGFMSQGGGNPDAHQAAAVTGSYRHGAFDVGLGWQRETDIGGVNNTDRDSATLGFRYRIGPGAIKAQWAASSQNGDQNDSRQWAQTGICTNTTSRCN